MYPYTRVIDRMRKLVPDVVPLSPPVFRAASAPEVPATSVANRLTPRELFGMFSAFCFRRDASSTDDVGRVPAREGVVA